MAQRYNQLYKPERSSLENCQQTTTGGARDRRDTWGRVARLTVVATLSEWTVLAIEIGGTSTAIERVAYLFGPSPK